MSSFGGHNATHSGSRRHGWRAGRHREMDRACGGDGRAAHRVISARGILSGVRYAGGRLFEFGHTTSNMIKQPALTERPSLKAGCRLSPPSSSESLLLIPEGALRLRGPGRRILELCDGERTLASVIEQLQIEFPAAEAGQGIRGSRELPRRLAGERRNRVLMISPPNARAILGFIESIQSRRRR